MSKTKKKFKLLSSVLVLGLVAVVPTILASCVQLGDNEKDPYISVKNTENNTKVIRLHPRGYQYLIGSKPKYLIDINPKMFNLFSYEMSQDEEFRTKYPHFFKGRNVVNRDQAYKEWNDFIYKNHKNEIFLLINDFKKFRVGEFIRKHEYYNTIKLKRELINQVQKVDFSKKSLLVFGLARFSPTTIYIAYNAGFWIKNISINKEQKKIDIWLQWSKPLKSNVDRKVGTAISRDYYVYFVEIDKINNLDDYEINYHTNS
ncbi:hypothetical protein [Ureaplasma diversum]|uniref:hypothetical protein n=1 Tax=Ureaplasma diversum TaxID=42094 RepID=UPI00056E6524|nr:hypothetical protein [Ureaplasma diversum]